MNWCRTVKHRDDAKSAAELLQVNIKQSNVIGTNRRNIEQTILIERSYTSPNRMQHYLSASLLSPRILQRESGAIRATVKHIADGVGISESGARYWMLLMQDAAVITMERHGKYYDITVNETVSFITTTN